MSAIMLTRSQILLLDIIRRLGNTSNDKIQLAKLQYFCDFINFAFHNQPISQLENLYERQKFGPLSRLFNDDLEVLASQNYLNHNGEYSYSLTSKSKKIEFNFSPEEQKTISFVVDRYGKNSWEELYKISHDQVPYLSSTPGGIVEYFTAYNLVDEYPEYKDFVAS